MASLNRCSFIGNIVRDPEIKYTPKGIAVTELGIAVNETYKTESGEVKENTTFLDITFWSKQAEILGDHGKKGRQVYVESRARLEQWTDKTTNQKRSKIRFVGESFQFLGARPQGAGGGNNGHSENGASRPSSTPVAAGNGNGAGFPADSDNMGDDIPF